jgi:hypothetical protein
MARRSESLVRCLHNKCMFMIIALRAAMQKRRLGGYVLRQRTYLKGAQVEEFIFETFTIESLSIDPLIILVENYMYDEARVRVMQFRIIDQRKLTSTLSPIIRFLISNKGESSSTDAF